jgi:tetratricopeptide (TPR) repeat protein
MAGPESGEGQGAGRERATGDGPARGETLYAPGYDPAARKTRDDRGAVEAYLADLLEEAQARPAWPDLRHKAAVAKLLLKDAEGARALLEPVVAAHPTYVDASRALAFAHLALGEPLKGIEVLARLEEKAGASYATSLARGLFLAAAKKRGAARAALEAAVGFDRTRPLGRYAHALACDDDDPGAGTPARREADEEFFAEVGAAAHDRQILGNPARALVFRDLAARCGEEGDEAGAARYMDLAFSIDLDLAADAAGRAEIALARGKVGEAVAGFRRAIEKDPGAVRARASLAFALVLEGDREGARAALQDAIARRPAWADLRRQFGDLLLEMGDAAQALEELSRAVELNPRYAAARYSLGRARLLTNDAAGAVECLRAACEGDAGDLAREAALTLLGRALLASGDPAGAEARLEEAAALDDALAEPHLVLALARETRGDLAGARAALAAYDARAGEDSAGAGGDHDVDVEAEAIALRGRLGA